MSRSKVILSASPVERAHGYEADWDVVDGLLLDLHMITAMTCATEGGC